MINLLITGVSGFVGHHYIQYLYDQRRDVEICGMDLREPSWDWHAYEDRLKIQMKTVNLLNLDELREAFQEFTPDYILHLASFSSVAFSWQHPSESFVNNTNLFLNLLTAVGETNKECRILSIGSSEEYGHVTEEDIPIKERLRLQPTSPYAVARVSQEMLSKLYVDSFGYHIVMTRSFNHIGPWQDRRFVVPSFVHRILAIRDAGKTEGEIETGNTEIIRDFVDVRDVVCAYELLLLKGRDGQMYNVCSGKGIALKDIISLIAEEVGVKVSTRVNPDFVRPDDNPIMVGSNYKICSQLGWIPKISLDETLKDIIRDAESEKKVG